MFFWFFFTTESKAKFTVTKTKGGGGGGIGGEQDGVMIQNLSDGSLLHIYNHFSLLFGHHSLITKSDLNYVFVPCLVGFLIESDKHFLPTYDIKR